VSTVSASQQQLPVSGIRLGVTEVSGWTPRELEIETLEGKHDLLTMKVLVAEKDPARWRDSPISFSWGTRTSGIGVFNGYVAAVQKAQDFQKNPLVTLTLMSASWKMTGGNPRFWASQTSEAIAKSIAAPHRLAVVADPSDYVWPAFAQTVESDWGALVKAAHSISFIVGMYNGVIRLIDPLRALNRGESVVRLMKSTNTFDEKALLIDFTPKATSRSDRISQTPKWAYLTSAGTSRQVNPDGIHFHSDMYIPDGSQARMLEDSLARNINAWNYRAAARVRGNAKISVGSVVEVVTGLSNTSVDANDGLWLVVGTKTILSDSSYQQVLMLARDRSRPATQVRAEPFWGRQARPTLRLSGDTWVSNWQNVA
jgi:hypothetical protein